ncbi:MAG: DUF21 domain-containing protein [Chitinivibrionales bacterium]|nr:DUF21 domain-containing protein [Chitinivibrionales bacterium]
MEPPPDLLCLIVLIVLLLLSSFFSVVKVIFSSSTRYSAATDDEREKYYASKIEKIIEQKEVLSATISFGKTCSNTSFSIVAFICLPMILPHLRLAQRGLIAFCFSAFFLSLFAYFIPRAVALRFFRELTPLTFGVYSSISWLLRPFASFSLGLHRLLLQLFKYDEKFAFLSDEEKSRMHQTEDHEEGLDEEEREMIRSIFELGDTTVKEIMVPRVDVKALEISTDFQTTLKAIQGYGHSRIPVYKHNIDVIAGVLYAKDIIGWISQNTPDNWDLSRIIKKAHFVPNSKKIDDLMAEFKAKKIHIALVVDEYGGTAGVVTMEDILEEIVGEIQDEYDEEEAPIVKVSDTMYRVDPHMDLEDLADKISINLDVEELEYNTLGGLIYHEYGDIPDENTVIDFEGLRLKVLKMDRQRIEKVQVELPQIPSQTSTNGKNGKGI